MKYCSQCGSSYPSDFQTCPKDQTVLQVASELAQGMVIRNKWIILDKIGAGGMATVYRVRHQAFGTIRAIKVINSRLAEDAGFVKRFHAEAVLAQKLQHPNVIRIEDLDSTEDGQPFIVMEYVAGRDLRSLIAQQGTLPIARALDITGQVASALAAAHRLGITHRDIKPDNILITTAPDGSDVVKVTDFGIAKARAGSAVGTITFGTETGIMVGTPAYMSPEQVEGKREGVDARSDLYSLCIVLYEMLTGKLPFESDTPLGMALSRLNNEPVPPYKAKPELNIPQLLSDVLMKALEKDREKRFQTAGEFMAALQDFAAVSAGMEAKTVIASAPVPPKEPPVDESSVPTIVPSPAPTVIPPAPLPQTDEAPSPAPPLPTPRRKPWWGRPLPLVVLGCLLVGVFLLVFFLMKGSRVSVKGDQVLRGHQSNVASVAFSLDGRYLASGSDDQTTKLWDVASGKELSTLRGHQGTVHSVAFSPDGRYLASGSYDKTIKLWDVASGQELRTLSTQESVNSIAFSPNGHYLASASDDKTIKLWDVASGQELRTLRGHQDLIWSVAFSPNGRYLASGSGDNNIKLWDSASGKELRTLRGQHQEGVMSVTFSPDGRSLASGSTDNTIKLWDVASGSELRTLRGHSYYIYSVTFSPNGRYLASGSGDHTIKLWDVASGSELRTLSGDQSWVNSVAFSPDGRYLASGSGDKTIKLWNVEHLVTAQQAQAQSGQIRNEAGSQAADAEQAVRNAVTAWVEAFRSKDAKALAECYAPFVEIYFRQHNLSHEQIKRYIESTFARTLDIRKYEVSDIRVQTSPADQGPTNVYSRATAVFHKEWETSETSGKTFAGEEIEQLTFTNSPQGWQIVREEELKILRVARR